jgi:hypothetical protein
MTIAKKDIKVTMSERGFRRIEWNKFTVHAHLHKLMNQKHWYYKLLTGDKDGNVREIFEVTAYGLPWNEKRFRESFGAALDYKDNARRVIKALFDDFEK